MSLVKSQFSKYEVVENLYSLETAASILAPNYPRMSVDALRANVVQRPPHSERKLSSISLFFNRTRGGDGHQPLSSRERGRRPAMYSELIRNHSRHTYLPFLTCINPF